MGTRCFILEELTQMWEDLGKRREGSEGGRETGAMVSAAHTGVCCSAEQSLQGNPRSRSCLLKGAHGESLTVAKKMEKRGQSWEMLWGGRERWVKGRRGATEDPRFLAWVPSRLSATYQDGDDEEAAAGPEQGGRWVRYRLGHQIQGCAKNSIIKTNNVPVQNFLIKINTPQSMINKITITIKDVKYW